MHSRSGRAPKRLRLRLFSIAGRFACHARVLVVHLAARHHWTELVLAGRTPITTTAARPG
jgi:hypothetical protein